MNMLIDWIEYGRIDRTGNSKRTVRRWINEARGHAPIIDRVNYPDCRRAYPGIARRG